MESIDTVCRHLAHSVFAVVTATEQVPAIVFAIVAINFFQFHICIGACHHICHQLLSKSPFVLFTNWMKTQEGLMTAVLDRVAVPHISLQVAPHCSVTIRNVICPFIKVSAETEVSGSGRLHMAPSRESLGLACLEAALQVGKLVGG